MINDFINTLTNKNAKGYRAYCLLANGQVGVSPCYTLETLKVWLEDTKASYIKVLDIREESEA